MTATPTRGSLDREAARAVTPQTRAQKPAAKGGAVRRAAALMNPRTVQQLQRGVGNKAVTALATRAEPGGTASLSAPTGLASATATPDVVEDPALSLQRKEGGGDCPPPAVPPAAPDPLNDPKFAKVKGEVASSAKTAKSHPPAKGEVGKAQAAAHAPADDKAKQAKAGQVADMAAAKPKGFDKAAFIAAVKTAIAKAAPANLDEADKFASSGKADAVKGEVMSKVGEGKEGSAKDVKASTDKPPDASTAKDKPVTPLAGPPAPKVPGVDGAKAMPDKAPASQTNLGAGPCDVAGTMADAGVTEKHLEKSNEPDMKGAVDAKKEAEAHAAQAPAGIREKEAQVLAGAKADATGDSKNAVGLMGVAKKAALGKVGADKSDTKSKDEAARARISGEVNRIFDATKTEVTAILTGLDTKVTTEFETGEAAARREFTNYHKTEMEKYKDERYSGALGWARWVDDLFMDLPPEANQIFVRAKALYETKMTAVISKVADVIATELDAAKARIALGRKQIDDFIAKEPKDLQKVAKEAAAGVTEKFGQLESDVDAKQESLVDDLASKYVEARNAVDEEIKAEQEKNKGLVSKAKDAVVGAIDTILKLKAMFMTVLAKASSALTLILDDPVKFINNFMNAVKQGLNQFVGNIWKHLKAGLLGWLFGALADAGIEIPSSFDLKGILQLVGSIFGLTLTNLKNRLVKAAPWIGTAIDFVMDKIEIIKILVTKGLSGVWEWIKDKLGDLKSMIMTPIIEFVKEKIITAGISWILGLLNPAGALVKIIQGLIGVVSWILERGQSLMEFISTVVDAVTDIAKGGVGGVPDKIEASLAKAVPLVISFLANLLGLGGISDKIKKILETVQKPVNKALDFVIKKGLALARPLISKLKGMAAKVKAKVLGGDDSPEGKEKRLNKGMSAGVSAANRFAGKRIGDRVLRPILNLVRMRYGLGVLEPVKQGKTWAIRGEVNRIVQRTGNPRTADTRTTRAESGEQDDANAPADSVNVPRRHAPGIAAIARHGQQGSSNRTGARIHHLESEHILPFRIGAMLWEELGLPPIARKSREDRGQTTIMLYKGAANKKTRASQAGTFRAHADMRIINALKAIMTRARRGPDQGQDDAAGGPQRARLRGLPADVASMSPDEIVEQTRIARTLETVRAHAVMRTNQAVREDYAATSEGIAMSHAERRGIPPGEIRPTPDEVESASTQQLADVKRMATEALAASLREQQ